MPGEVLSIARRTRTGGRQNHPHWPRGRVTDEASLRQRILRFPIVAKANLPTPDPCLARLASALLDAHAMRGRFFSPELLADPAWAMLLLVYGNEGRTADVSINALCESPVTGPVTIALRWIVTLLDDGVLQRTEDETRPGQIFVRLSPDAQKNLEKWLRFLTARLHDRDRTDAAPSI